MWPQALQMTRDECRGILRRLELESYSQVISVFRAQGGLSDAKAKLLEELRGILHISNERHRAEARRVANDEQLATIAEAISGPNTWQEWSREGRRPYPMLPRVAPQTALALLANTVAEETTLENSKLPYPAETAEAIKEDQTYIERKSKEGAEERSNYVVTCDPFKIPDIPSNTKKNLKRISDQQTTVTGKKRISGDNSAQQVHPQTARKNYPHITANSPQSGSAPSSTNANSDRKQKLNSADVHLEKQRFFHRQHQLAKQKMAKKAAAAAATANNAAMGGSMSLKRHATPAKSGRRANQKLHREQQKQLAIKQMQMDIQQQQQVPMQIDLTCTGGIGTTTSTAAQSILTQQQIDMQFVTYATHHQPPQQIFMEKDIEGSHSQLSTLPVGAASTAAISATTSSSNQYPPSLIAPLSSPQIAASKRDISKNLNKLQMQQNQQQLSSNVSSALPASTSMPSHDLQTSLGNILSSSATSSSDKNKSSEKTLISTTPVQKYIVEERQPGITINLPASSNPNALVNMQNPQGSTSTQTHILQVSNAGQQPQIMSFPQISAAATKLRAVNTTLIAPGNKITSTPTKKFTPGSLSSSSTAAIGSTGSPTINAGALHELANVASTHSQVLHVVETAGNNNPTNATHGTPLHTPPAVIQIHNTAGGSTAMSSDISPAPTHSKMVTTKILPLVLSGAGNQNSANNNLLNTSTLVMAATPSTSINITSTTSTAGGSTIIKNLSSNILLNTSTANLTPVTVTSTNNPIISTLGSGATVFRKPLNIIKTPIGAGTPIKSTSSSSAPHIISNVKLTPVSVGPSSSGTHLTTASTFKNVLPSTSGMVRTSVKICQSPNGKVFIQSAGLVDSSKMKLNTSSMSHKIISNPSGANSSTITSGGPRIAIQNVQIIPAPMNSAVSGNTLQTATNHINTKAGKSNMIFMPTSATNVRPVTLSKMGNNLLLKSSANQQMTATSPTTTTAGAASDNSMAKSNIVVLGPSPATLVKEQASQNLRLENAQLINEDTPLDILNMPIVMEPGVGVASSSSAAETLTVLPSNIIDTSNTSSSALASPLILDQTQLHQSSKTVVLNVDWEMKLDIEQQNQYNNKNLKQNKRTTSTSSSTKSVSSNNQQSSFSTGSHGSKQKTFKNDYISMELKAKDSSKVRTTTLPTTTSNSANNVIVLDDSFDDVIVEEHEDDASSITSLDKHEQLQQHQNDNDIPKILDMQIYQQHDGHDNRVAQMKTTNDEDVDILDVNDDDDDDDNDDDDENKNLQSKQFIQSQESSSSAMDASQHELHRKEQQLSDIESCETDARFDETIVAEIDENTALEYIEEDCTSSNISTTTTETSVATLSKKYSMQQQTSANTLPTTAITTTISNQEDAIKSGNTTSNNNLGLSLPSGNISAVTTSSNETQQSELTITTTPTANATQEKTANNSATQQVEP